MSRIPGPPVNQCPLKPAPIPDNPTPEQRQRGVIRYKRLLWKRPTGWVVALGVHAQGSDGVLVSGFETLAADLACWHLAAHVAAGAKWHGPVGRFGSDAYQPPGWSTPSLPVRHECWGDRS